MAHQHSPEHDNDGLLATEALDMASLLEACGNVFLNHPDETVLDSLRIVAQTADNHDFDDIAADDPLRQRYEERLVQTDSPLYVPLFESSIAGSTVDEKGAVHYGPTHDDRTAHVLLRYEELEFDPSTLAGAPDTAERLHPDSIAAELAFLAFLKKEEAASWEMGDHASAVRWHEVARAFSREHPNAWLALAAERLAAGDDDLYARACNLAAEAVVRIAKEE